MILPSHALVLLDTSVLVHLARQDATGVWIENHFALTARADRPLISTITEGEILGFARQRNWGATRMADLTRLLGEVVRVDAGLPEVVDAYADLSVLDCGADTIRRATTSGSQRRRKRLALSS